VSSGRTGSKTSFVRDLRLRLQITWQRVGGHANLLHLRKLLDDSIPQQRNVDLTVNVTSFFFSAPCQSGNWFPLVAALQILCHKSSGEESQTSTWQTSPFALSRNRGAIGAHKKVDLGVVKLAEEKLLLRKQRKRTRSFS